MKKAIHLILEIGKACGNILMGALCFIRFDHDVAILPNGEGGVEQVNYYYSIYDKLLGANLQFLVYIALAVMAASVALSVMACIARDNRKIRLVSHGIFVVSVLFFLALLFYATQVLRLNY